MAFQASIIARLFAVQTVCHPNRVAQDAMVPLGMPVRRAASLVPCCS
jgi:hypothetical protein